MLFAPPFGLLAPGRAGSKDLPVFTGFSIIMALNQKVKENSTSIFVISVFFRAYKAFDQKQQTFLISLRA